MFLKIIFKPGIFSQVNFSGEGDPTVCCKEKINEWVKF